jgi:carboxyl-terminal processing protease
MRLTPFRAAILGIALLGTALTPILVGAQEESQAVTGEQRSPEEVYSDLSLLGEVFDLIRAEYVDAPDERELVRAAINGMLVSLDPHSGYLAPEAASDMEQSNRGQFGGLGIEVTQFEGLIRVISPYDDGPAAKAGILSEDRIVKIGDEEVYGLTLDESVEMMRGEIGTPITVSVQREGVEGLLTFDLMRDAIPIRAVRWEMEGDVAVMRLSRFSEQAFVGIRDAVEDVYAERSGKAPAGIILDLRNNPGGLVDQAQYVADAFLHQGSVVLTRGRTPAESGRLDAQPDALDEQLADVPLIVLINGGSASASEIVAGALQDHKRATIIGTRSYGKGSVQTIISLGDNGAMRLTTSRYYTPNNRSIQAAGIQPDILITQDVPPELQGRDEIIGEAGLAGEIGGGTEEKATTGSSVYVPSDRAKDNQLQYALRLIRGEERSAAYPPNPEG